MEKNRDLILFDGVCNLCNRTVQFIIKRDHKDCFCFSSLQSAQSEGLLKSNGYTLENINSVVLVQEDKIYTHSTAALKIARQLSGIWPIFSALLIIPQPIRDFFYKIVANNRYRWFGKKEVCFVPDDRQKKKFL